MHHQDAKTPGKSDKTLFDAIAAGSVEGVRRRLQAGADPNFDGVEEVGERTPLMEAAARGEPEFVRLLVAAGANVNALVEDLTGELDQFPYIDELFQRAVLRDLSALAYAAVFDRRDAYEFLFPVTNGALRAKAAALRDARASDGSLARRPGSRRPPAPTAPREFAKRTAGADLLASRPGLQRWMNECSLCGRQGYKPELPEEVDRRGSAAELRRLFKVLPLTADRNCERCAEKVQRAFSGLAHRRRGRG